MILINYTIEDAELLQLLERQCLHRAFPESKYLVDTRVKSKREYIFQPHDENGCTLLHYALKLFWAIFLNKRAYDVKMHCILQPSTTKTNMAAYLINNYPALNSFIPKDNNGAFAPVHLVA